jgi:hypothetical protein
LEEDAERSEDEQGAAAAEEENEEEEGTQTCTNEPAEKMRQRRERGKYVVARRSIVRR